jgi:hypothetical protein
METLVQTDVTSPANVAMESLVETALVVKTMHIYLNIQQQLLEQTARIELDLVRVTGTTTWIWKPETVRCVTPYVENVLDQEKHNVILTTVTGQLNLVQTETQDAHVQLT